MLLTASTSHLPSSMSLGSYSICSCGTRVQTALGVYSVSLVVKVQSASNDIALFPGGIFSLISMRWSNTKRRKWQDLTPSSSAQPSFHPSTSLLLLEPSVHPHLLEALSHGQCGCSLPSLGDGTSVRRSLPHSSLDGVCVAGGWNAEF